MGYAFKIDGLDELLRELENAPAHLQAEAEARVVEAANETAARVRAVYEANRTALTTYTVKGGIKKARRHLADSVEVTTRGRESGAAVARVRVTAPHAYWFEYGTAERQWTSGKSTGAARPGADGQRPTFVPTAMRQRRQMKEALVAIVEQSGLKVTGDG